MRAGLYVGLGAFGIAAARLVSSGNFAGNRGPPLGIPRGPRGLPFMPFELPFQSAAEGIDIGELCTEEFEPRESGLVVVSMPAPDGIRKRANRSLSASLPLVRGKPFNATPPCDRARP